MTPTRYSAAAIALHWLLALALAFQISLGWTLEGPNGPALFARYQLHKSVGITILVLSLARLAIRLTVPRPAPSGDPAWTRRFVESVHSAFYVVMIGAPLTGWLIVSTAKMKVPTLLFGVVPLPHLQVGTGWHEPAERVHGALAYLAMLLLLLHVAGALRHQWLLGKPELQRMIPFARGRGILAVVAAFALLVSGVTIGKFVSPDPTPVAQAVAAAQIIATEPDAALAVEPAAGNLMARATEPESALVVESAAGNIQAPATEPEGTPQPLATWTVATGGRVGFTARWNGEPVRGQFSAWRATIRFSPDLLDKSSINATIDLASADTGDGQRDETLKGSDFFDTALHPRATFTSQRITRIAGDRYAAEGTLDLHGVARRVTLRFTLRIDDATARVTGSTSIDRTAFRVGQGEWAATDAIAADVAIDLAFAATRN